jgi:hypothetical protein
VIGSVVEPFTPNFPPDRLGQGDYLKLRDELFAGETVESLCEKAKAASGSK